MKQNPIAPVSKIQRFSIHDGPGIRTTVFLKGCHLRCAWCHNPEMIKRDMEILYASDNCIGCGACFAACKAGAHALDENRHHIFVVSRCKGCLACVENCPSGAIEAAGMMMSCQEIMDVVLRDKAFYGAEGGMTLSGGEPLIHADACAALLKSAKANGIATAIETSGLFYMPESDMEELATLTDLFLWDFKDGNNERHETFTGLPNDEIIANLIKIDKSAKKIILRCIMVNNINMDTDNFSAIAGMVQSLKSCTDIELIPYHAYGGVKSKLLGYADNGRKEWIPSADDIKTAKEVLRGLGCNVI